MTTFFVILAGFFIRLGLPLLLTVGLVSLLRRLDARWQAQAKLAVEDSGEHALELKDCVIEGIAKQLTVQSSDPCWQVFRKSNGYLHDECLNCKVFRAAPILLPNN